jgi:hypothetical protein
MLDEHSLSTNNGLILNNAHTLLLKRRLLKLGFFKVLSKHDEQGLKNECLNILVYLVPLFRSLCVLGIRQFILSFEESTQEETSKLHCNSKCEISKTC